MISARPSPPPPCILLMRRVETVETVDGLADYVFFSMDRT